MTIDRSFQDYLAALERSGGADRCFLCRRTPADVKAFFGFHEDGTPLDPAAYGIEDIVLEKLDIMSYRGLRPVCAVCQLNVDALLLAGELPLVRAVLEQMTSERERLWPSD
jgi:hypothetical protein